MVQLLNLTNNPLGALPVNKLAIKLLTAYSTLGWCCHLNNTRQSFFIFCYCTIVLKGWQTTRKLRNVGSNHKVKSMDKFKELTISVTVDKDIYSESSHPL